MLLEIVDICSKLYLISGIGLFVLICCFDLYSCFCDISIFYLFLIFVTRCFYGLISLG